MSKDFLLVLIFITIYAKSSYTLPRDTNNVEEESLYSKTIGRAIDSIYKPTRPQEPKLYYNKTSRRFFIYRKQFDEARSKKESEPTGYIESFLDFISGIFLDPFSPPEDRRPPQKKNKKTKKSHKHPEEYNDPILGFLEDLGDMFQGSSEQSTQSWYDDDYEESSAETNVYIVSPQDVENLTKAVKNPNKIVKQISNPTTITYAQFLESTKPKNPKDCTEKPTSWMPQIFGYNNAIETTTPSKISAPASSGWFSFFTGGTDDDLDDDYGDTTEPSTSWFGGFFSDSSSSLPATTTKTTTTTTQPTTTTTTQSTTTSSPIITSWFNAFLNSEEDEEAYPNTTDARQKKGRRRNYKGYQLLRLYPNSVWKVNDLQDLQEDTQGSGLMWWTSPALNRSADLLVPPDLLSDVKDHLNGDGMQYDVVIWDLQKAIAFENPKLTKMQRLELESTRGHPLTWKRYHRYADILRYLEYLSLKYSDMVDLIPLGRSSEGLPIMGAKVSFPIYNTTDASSGEKKKWKLKSRMKPAIWIDGGIHAREWISPAVVTWILHTLIEGDHGNGAEMEMLKMADWYFLPVVNPDGYEYTHTKDRLWRKSRSAYPGSNVYYNSWFPWNWGNTECIGVDLNRNWDYHWGEKGSSNDPCNDYYAGPNPFSEPETRSISNFLMENRDQMKVYLTLHAYSQMWLLPSTHSREPFTDSAELMEMGKLALNALRDVSGTHYEIGSMSDLLLPITGTAHDWAKGRAAIKYSYAVKMRDSRGPYGFLLPGSQIAPTAKETWEAIKTIVDNL